MKDNPKKYYVPLRACIELEATNDGEAIEIYKEITKTILNLPGKIKFKTLTLTKRKPDEH